MDESRRKTFIKDCNQMLEKWPKTVRHQTAWKNT